MFAKQTPLEKMKLQGPLNVDCLVEKPLFESFCERLHQWLVSKVTVKTEANTMAIRDEFLDGIEKGIGDRVYGANFRPN